MTEDAFRKAWEKEEKKEEERKHFKKNLTNARLLYFK